MDFFVWQRTVVDEAGNILPNAEVSVTDVVSGSLVQLYSDLGVTGVGNPITADSDGFVQFYVRAGFYDIVATLDSSSRTWNDEAVGAPIRATDAEAAAAVDVIDASKGPGNVLRYGGIGDDSTDNAAAFQRAIDQAAAGGAAVFIPPGIYRIGSELLITEQMEIYGEGKLRSVVKKTTEDGGCFVVQTNDAVHFHDFSMTASTTQTGGSYISLDGDSGTGTNLYSRISNLRLGSAWIAIDTNRAAGWVIDGCYIVESQRGGIYVESAAAVDNGDSVIRDCIFDTSAGSGSYGVRMFSSGGLRVISNKFLRHEFQFSLEIGAGIDTSVLIIANNSFENPVTTNIVLDENNTGTFGKVSITGNQITANGTGYGINARGMYNLVITGNAVHLGGSTTACMLFQSCTDFFVTANQMYGGAGTGISVDSGSSNGVIGLNHIRGISTHISNSSSSTTVERKMLTASATWDAGSMAADGDIVSTTIAVTGAKLGDPAAASLTTIGSFNIPLMAWVSAADTVKVVLLNKTGAAADPTSGTLTAVVFTSQ